MNALNRGQAFAIHGRYAKTDTAVSPPLEGFPVTAAELFRP